MLMLVVYPLPEKGRDIGTAWEWTVYSVKVFGDTWN